MCGNVADHRHNKANEMKIQTKPEYRDSNPKIDLYILCNDGVTLKYYGSTNWWRTVRDCLNFYNRSSGHNGLLFVKGVIDRLGKA